MAEPATNHDAEASVIGAILLHPVCIADVLDVARADDFSHPALRAIFEGIVACDKASKPIDVLTVVAEMKSAETLPMLNQLGGKDYLVELQANVFSVENVRYHAKIIAARARRRRCTASLTELRNAALGSMGDEDFFSEMDRSIAELLATHLADTGPRDVGEALHDFVVNLKERYERRQRGEDLELLGIPTGFAKIDAFLDGLQAAKFYLLAARPGMGKTAWMLNAAAHAALAGFPVLGFSLEMLDLELVGRMLSFLARINGKHIERAQLNPDDWKGLMVAGSKLSKFPMKIDHSSGLTFDAIRSRARRWRMKHPRDAKGKYTQKALIWIDYLQLIKGAEEGERQENRQQEITRISSGLKDLTKELQCPVVALSQLNRALENRDDKRPKQSDLRESGSLEQDADVICFLYRDEVYSKAQCAEEDKGVAEFIVSKQRGGPTGFARLAWLDIYTKFETLAEHAAEGDPHWSDAQ